MLKKVLCLFKYEFKYYMRLLGALYIALFAFSLAGGLQNRFSEGGAIQNLTHLILSALFIAISVAMFILNIQRFRENTLGAQGYLTLTLPFSVWTHTAVKSVSALAVYLVSSVVFAAAVLVYAVSSKTGAWDADPEMWQSILDAFNGGKAEIAMLALISVITIFQQICLFYALLTASQMLPKFRVAAAFLAYFIVMFFVQQPVLQMIGGDNWMENLLQMKFLTALALENAIFAALYFYICGVLLKNTLNLE